MRRVLILLAGLAVCRHAAAEVAVSSRVASFFVSQDLINEMLKEHLKNPYLPEFSIEMDPSESEITALGLLKIPIEEMRALNLDKSLQSFRFQVTIQMKTTRQGHLILTFPFDETYLYPATSKDKKGDRVVIPNEALTLAMASMRGYMAAAAGDYSGFDRKAQQLNKELADT